MRRRFSVQPPTKYTGAWAGSSHFVFTQVSGELFRMKQDLIGRIENRSAKIGIVGLGYVGLPLMLRFSEAGFNVLGFDIDVEKVNALNSGQSYIEHGGLNYKVTRQKDAMGRVICTWTKN